MKFYERGVPGMVVGTKRLRIPTAEVMLALFWFEEKPLVMSCGQQMQIAGVKQGKLAGRWAEIEVLLAWPENREDWR